METILLAGVIQTDTHKRLQVAEQLNDYFRKEDSSKEFPEFERLVAGLAVWMNSSNFKVSVCGMQVVESIVVGRKDKFRSFIPTIFPQLKERLGDSKDQVREQAQHLIQSLMTDSVSSPQVFLDKLLESCLVHKNWRVKEQGLLCLSRTLSYFGSGQISVGKFMSAVCSLLGDANSQVRSVAMETIVEIYRHVGFRVRADLSKRGLPSARMSQLTARFNAVDATSGNHTNLTDNEDDRDSVSSSCGSSCPSARTHGSSKVVSSSTTASTVTTMGGHATGGGHPPGNGRRHPPPPARSSVPSRLTSTTSSSSSGAVTEADFEKAFSVSIKMNLYSQHDVEKALANLSATLSETSKSWDLRVTALKELRAVAEQDVMDHGQFAVLLKGMESPLIESLKDLRSQITKEACVSISYVCVLLGAEAATFAAAMLSQLIALLPNSAKVMSTSAEVCLQFIVKHSPSQRILHCLSSIGFTSKSAVLRRCCAEIFLQCVTIFDISMMNRILSLIEDLIQIAIKDPDAMARKHGRQAYWVYMSKFPSPAQRLMDSLNPQTQKHLNDERTSMAASNPTSSSCLSRVANHLGPRKATTFVAPGTTSQDQVEVESCSSPQSSPGHTPSVRVIRPTLRSRPVSRQTNSVDRVHPSSSSALDSMLQQGDGEMEEDSHGPTSPLSHSSSLSTCQSSASSMLAKVASSVSTPSSSATIGRRPPSRTGGQRPPSRSGARPSSRTGMREDQHKVSGAVGNGKPGSKGRVRRISRSVQPSPAHSRESSPTNQYVGRRNSGSRKIAPLTADSLKILCGNSFIRDDDDDVISLKSDRSALSFSSEISINPYTKYTKPIEDLNELVAMCSSHQWSERRDGIAQLHLLLESSRPFSHSDMEKVKAVFKRMFQEPHSKVYSMFLDTLSKFIMEHREHLDDWLFILLLKLLQRSGTDMLSSVLFKLQMVLENIRKAFEPDCQFAALCRIVTDPMQTLNSKVKLAFLEYLLELLPMIDPSDFKDSQEIRQAVGKIVRFTTEPKSAEIRKQSQRAIIALFALSPATFSLMQRTLPKADQESANRILKTYMSEMPSSGDESDKESSAIASSKARKATHTKSLTSSRQQSKTTRFKGDVAASLPPSGPRGLKGVRQISSSSPNMYGEDLSKSLTASSTARGRLMIPSGGRTTPSLIPTPKGGLSRPMSTTPGSGPSTLKGHKGKRVIPPRSASVGPEKLACQLYSRSNGGSPGARQVAVSVSRPGSARSDYTPSLYQNGESEGNSPTPLEFSFSDLPNLDFGSPDEDEEEYEDADKDHMCLVVKRLSESHSSEWQNILQTLYALVREFPDKCKWEEYFKTVLVRLVTIFAETTDCGHKVLVLRIIREMLKSGPSHLKNYAEMTTMKVLKAYADPDPLVSQAAEDVFPLLAPAIPTDCALSLLAPIALTEKYPMLLGIIKLLTKIIGEVEVEYLESKLAEVIPGVTRGYCHSESSVRKASVFCLVAIHNVVGDKMKEHLHKLSSSQSKLLDLYIKRNLQDIAKTGTTQNSTKTGGSSTRNA